LTERSFLFGGFFMTAGVRHGRDGNERTPPTKPKPAPLDFLYIFFKVHTLCFCDRAF